MKILKDSIVKDFLSFLIGIIAISSIILFSANSSSISSTYAQDTQYYNNNTNENFTSSLLINELENIKNILESKVTKLATVLQIATNLPQILQPPNVNLIDSKLMAYQKMQILKREK